MFKKKVLYLGAVVILVLIVLVSTYWYFGIERPRQIGNEFIDKYQTAYELHNAGRVQESVDAFYNILKIAPSKEMETQIKFMIAFNTLFRNQNDDKIRAIQMYKDIIADASVESIQRAIAINEMISFSENDERFAREVIFKGEPFEKYLKEARSLDYEAIIPYAIRRASEFAETLHPISLNEFAIAQWYSGAIVSGKVKNEMQRKELISKLKEWTEKGEQNLSEMLNIGYPRSKIGLVYYLNALARKNLTELGNIGNYSTVEDLFKKSLEIFESENNIYSYSLSLYTRFYYAAMLANVYGSNRKSDIEKILNPVIMGPPKQWKDYNFSFYEFLKNNISQFNKSYINNLIKIIPKLKTVLSAKGIDY